MHTHIRPSTNMARRESRLAPGLRVLQHSQSLLYLHIQVGLRWPNSVGGVASVPAAGMWTMVLLHPWWWWSLGVLCCWITLPGRGSSQRQEADGWPSLLEWGNSCYWGSVDQSDLSEEPFGHWLLWMTVEPVVCSWTLSTCRLRQEDCY